MEELITTMTAKGQVTIPVSLRRRLHLEPADKVAFILDGDEVKIRPVERSLMTGYRSVKPRQQPEDFDAIRRETQEWVAKQVINELHDSKK
jgi:AbrB family looped-hinge helix DNA binding protein